MNPHMADVLVDVGPEAGAALDEGLLRHAVLAALGVVEEAEGARLEHLEAARLEVSVRITGDEEMHALNRQFRGVDRPTDVLSFSPFEDGETPTAAPAGETQSLGDIVLSYPYARRQAEDLGHSVEMELSWLAIHGTLQLLGYRHDTDADAEHMEALEHRALGTLGFTAR